MLFLNLPLLNWWFSSYVYWRNVEEVLHHRLA